MKYRVEDKYLITEDMMAYLKTKLTECMQPDPNMHGEKYLIRSIYFDDMYNSCLDENEDGCDAREKYRIRMYNCDTSFIRLERKGKNKGYTYKDSALIDEKTAAEYINCGGSAGSVLKARISIDENTPQLLKRLWAESHTRLMSPVNIVEYERTAYTERMGNVRITFDCNIGFTDKVDRFMDDKIQAVPILPVGQHILEVKYDELLPDHIREIIDIGDLNRTAFSKYYYSRTAEILN